MFPVAHDALVVARSKMPRVREVITRPAVLFRKVATERGMVKNNVQTILMSRYGGNQDEGKCRKIYEGKS